MVGSSQFWYQVYDGLVLQYDFQHIYFTILGLSEGFSKAIFALKLWAQVPIEGTIFSGARAPLGLGSVKKQYKI